MNRKWENGQALGLENGVINLAGTVRGIVL